MIIGVVVNLRLIGFFTKIFTQPLNLAVDRMAHLVRGGDKEEIEKDLK